MFHRINNERKCIPVCEILDLAHLIHFIVAHVLVTWFFSTPIFPLLVHSCECVCFVFFFLSWTIRLYVFFLLFKLSRYHADNQNPKVFLKLLSDDTLEFQKHKTKINPFPSKRHCAYIFNPNTTSDWSSNVKYPVN